MKITLTKTEMMKALRQGLKFNADLEPFIRDDSDIGFMHTDGRGEVTNVEDLSMITHLEITNEEI